MEDVDLRYAKEHLEELIERVRRGEDVRISDPEGGALRLVRDDGGVGPRTIFLGQWSHLAEISEERLLAPLGDDELEWLSGERSSVE